MARYRLELAAVPSLRTYLAYQPHLVCATQVHGGRLAPHVVREWTLARCGHHPFPDGRTARHCSSGGAEQPCLCGSPHWSLIHGLRVCPLFGEQRRGWMLPMQRSRVDVAQVSNDDFLRLIFMLQHPLNSPSLVLAHVRFVASVCTMQRWLMSGALSP